MEARLLIEPLMPGLIVRYATAADFAKMVECLDTCVRSGKPCLALKYRIAKCEGRVGARGNARFLKTAKL
jgi:hypothetical protein